MRGSNSSFIAVNKDNFIQMKYGLFFGAITFGTLLLCLTACQQKRQEKSNAVGSPEKAVGGPALDRYWDAYDFTDTAAMKNPDIGEQGFVDFLALLPTVSLGQANNHITGLLSKAESDSTVFAHFVALAERYLHHPNSPMYNESYYEPVLDFLTTSKWSDNADRWRAKKELNLIRKNRPGHAAEDFSFRPASGRASKMSEIEGLYTVLFFYEPGCPSCEEAIAQLSADNLFKALVGDGRVKMLAVYASGDKKAWEGYRASLPEDWINAFDEKMAVLTNDLYDLKASPTIYLLDQEKKVILKDTNVRALLNYFYLRR